MTSDVMNKDVNINHILQFDTDFKNKDVYRPKGYVFISYTTNTKEKAEKLCNFLEFHGIKCFLPCRDVKDEVNRSQLIKQAVEECQMILVEDAKLCLYRDCKDYVGLCFATNQKYVYGHCSVDLNRNFGTVLNHIRMYMHSVEDGIPLPIKYKEMDTLELKTKAEDGDVECQCEYGMRMLPKECTTLNPVGFEGLKWIQKAADSGFLPAWYQIYEIQSTDYYGLHDPVSAINSLEKSANMGYLKAMDKLSFLYQFGDKYNYVDINTNEALKWLFKAAELGYAHSQFWLGLMYDRGEMLKKDINEASKWYCKAALNEYADAINSVGDLYYYGEVVNKDVEEAIKWYYEAVRFGSTTPRWVLNSFDGINSPFM